jgi:hypothetical protein
MWPRHECNPFFLPSILSQARLELAATQCSVIATTPAASAAAAPTPLRQFQASPIDPALAATTAPTGAALTVAPRRATAASGTSTVGALSTLSQAAPEIRSQTGSAIVPEGAPFLFGAGSGEVDAPTAAASGAPTESQAMHLRVSNFIQRVRVLLV